nr:DMT family transporter [uncultured Gellertiella sp.]
MRSYHLGLLLVTASAIAWSTAGLFTRLIGLDAPLMLFWRGIFGALALGLVILVIERKNPVLEILRMGRDGWIFAGLSGVGMICFITSLKLTTVAHVAVIYAVIPFLAGGLGWIMLGEVPGMAAIVASLLALVGVAIMVGFGGEGSLAGDFLALMMTSGMAIMMIMSRKSGTGMAILPAAALSALVSAFLCLPFSGTLGVDGHSLWLLLLFGVTNSACGLAFFTYGSRHLPPVESGLIGALDAPLSPLWTWLLINEVPGAPTLVGGGLVFAAVIGHVLVSAVRSPVAETS